MANFLTLNGLTDYLQILSLMEEKVSQVIEKSSEETIYLTEHTDVYTAGTNFKPQELLTRNNIPVVYTGRGGKFTYHGKGQRVIYPILDLSSKHRQKDLKLYVRNLEQWIINSLAHFGVTGYTVPLRVGIWVKINEQEFKIAAIGVRIKKWVTYHGIAVNIATNLDKYNGIIPCGLPDFPVTSLIKLGVDINLTEFDEVLKQEFSRVF